MSAFQDLFSNHAACYAQSRPKYPPALFSFVAGLSKARQLAWDVGTGNGQAAVGLADHFDRIIATDGSPSQIAHARQHERVSYHIATAEAAGPKEGLEDGSVDLVTVAQALHWFKFDVFYANVRRVLRPGGVIAAWCYGIHQVEPAIDAVTDHYYREVTGPYWPSDRRFIDEKYATLPFAFDEMAVDPRLECREHWNLPQYVGYLESWSATQRFREAQGADPLDQIAEPLAKAWGDSETRRWVVWPIHMRIGTR